MKTSEVYYGMNKLKMQLSYQPFTGFKFFASNPAMRMSAPRMSMRLPVMTPLLAK